jgi:cephalosporin hydroxylase
VSDKTPGLGGKVLERVRLLATDPSAFYRKVSLRLRGRYQPVLRREFRAQFGLSVPEWLYYHHRELIKKKQVSWMGVPTLKSALDAWIYQEILHEIRPDVLVEIGSWAGGSTLYFAHLLDLLDHGQVVSVDIDRTHYRVKHPRIVEVTGDSGSPEVVAAVAAICAGKSALVVHDGAHTRERVLRDLRAYAPLVAVGSYLIVEDGVSDVFVPGKGIGKIKQGPLPAVEEFLRSDGRFVADRSRERYLITYNPKGYLKRLA